MISFPLAIRLSSQSVHTPTAWFIPGDDPRVWLEEIARWDGTGDDLLPLPVLRGRAGVGVSFWI